MDRHVLGAVVLEDTPDIRCPRDERQVTQEDRNLDDALDEGLSE